MSYVTSPLTRKTNANGMILTSVLSRLMFSPPFPIIPPACYVQHKATNTDMTNVSTDAFDSHVTSTVLSH